MWNWFAFAMGVVFFSPVVLRWDVKPAQTRLLSDDCGSLGFKWALLYKNTRPLYLLPKRQTSVCWLRWASTENPINHLPGGLLWSFSLTVPRYMFLVLFTPFPLTGCCAQSGTILGWSPKSFFVEKLVSDWKIVPDSETNWSLTGKSGDGKHLQVLRTDWCKTMNEFPSPSLLSDSSNCIFPF